MGVGEIVAELELVLAGLLRNVDVCAELRAIRESNSRRYDRRLDQIVPVLKAGRETVHQARAEYGVERDVGQNQIVQRDVRLCKVNLRCVLVVIALVVLSQIADEHPMLFIEVVIDAAVVAFFIEGRWNRM